MSKCTVCYGLGCCDDHRRSWLVLVPLRVKLNSDMYISLILVTHLLPWAKDHFHGSPWSLQQDSAPSHGSKATQTWIQKNILSFISKNAWPARSTNLNPLDFSIWLILERRISASSHTSFKSLKAKLQKEWEVIPQEPKRSTCNAFTH